MLPSQHWAHHFDIGDDDLEFLTGLLLEREMPLSSTDLARALVEQRLSQEAAALQARYRDVRVYNPSGSFDVGHKLVFPAFNYAVGTVTSVRSGDNPEYGEFNVVNVTFDDDAPALAGETHEFAADLKTGHKLAEQTDGGNGAYVRAAEFNVDDIVAVAGAEIAEKIEAQLETESDLVRLAGHWFPRSLMLEVNEGHLHLAEAVLDLAGGGPMDAAAILEQIGGLGSAPQELQEFSINYALNQDERFDEVGPAGQVLWYLARLEPPEVSQAPLLLRYTDMPYDRSLLTAEMLALETEIDDEHSPERQATYNGTATVTLIYPHRRSGTLPLNTSMRSIFPTARRTSRIWVTLVDGEDGEEFTGWVVHRDRYVLGLTPYYRKHKPPVGAYVSVRPGDAPGKMVVGLKLHRPRTEYIRLISVKDGQVSFDNHKRAIGAEYDDLLIVGADDLAAVDALAQAAQRRPLTGILRQTLAELSRLTPQGTVHAKTLYSAVNMMRRCPPGPIFAALASDPDFEHVGNHYWRLTSS